MAHIRRHGWLVVMAGIAVFLLASASEAEAQSRRRPSPRYLGGHTPDQIEGARILDDMREIGLAGDYYEEFELRLLPRKGKESRVQGRWFGGRNAIGPVSRIELFPVAAAAEVLWVQNGPDPEVWRLHPGAPPTELAGGVITEPLVGTTLSAADLQIPFMYWRDFVFEGREEVLGRPTFVFLLFPPEAEAEKFPGIGGARVFIDTQFHAPLQAQWIDDDGEALKTITVLSLKKVEDRYIVKSFEVRDEQTRDKTRLVVTAVSFTANMPESLLRVDGPGDPAELDLSPEQVTAVR